MFWDGSRWVDERLTTPPASPAAGHRRRLRDWAATIPILALVPALLIPFLSTGAASASLTVSGKAVPGATIFVVGHGFAPRDRIQFSWDGSRNAMPALQVGAAGGLTARVTIPTSTRPGNHQLAAVRQAPQARLRSLSEARSSNAVLQPGPSAEATSAATTAFEPLASVIVNVGATTTKGAPKPNATTGTVSGSDPASGTGAGGTGGSTPTSDPGTEPGATSTADPAGPPDPTATSTLEATPTPRPTATPAPTATADPTSPPVDRSITVRSIPALLKALADNSLDEIVVADGTYRVSPASLQRADSLWIGADFAGRTRAITVRAASRGGVTFDGGGASSYGCISFEEGAHDQTWDGFGCANGNANSTGVITFGGYAGSAAAHDITLNHISIKSSCTGNSTSASAPATDHAIYVSMAAGGPHDLLFSNVSVDGRGGLASAFHFYHSDGSNKNGWNVTARNLSVVGTQQAIMLWDATLHGITFDGVDISGAIRYGVRYEAGTGITLRNVTTTGSGTAGFYSSKGATPAGVTFSGDDWR